MNDSKSDANNDCDSNEPLLQDNGDMIAVLNPKFKFISSYANELRANMWFSSEFHFEEDMKDWDNKLKEGDRTVFKFIMAFFASGDLLVNENLVSRFLKEIKLYEAQDFIIAQMFNENEHAKTYANAIKTFIKDEKEIHNMNNSIARISNIKNIGAWVEKWITSNERLAKRLIAFSIFEGVIFQMLFAFISYYSDKKIMKEFGRSNDAIAADEACHSDFTIALYNNIIVNKLSDEEFKDIIVPIVNIMCDSIKEMFEQISLQTSNKIKKFDDVISESTSMVGITYETCVQYMHFVANRHAKAVKHAIPFDPVDNPFSFMKTFALSKQYNFFELTSVNYNAVPTEKPLPPNYIVGSPNFKKRLHYLSIK